MFKNYYVSLVIPCRNEAKALKTVLERLPKQIDEVIIVDNNSKDNTRKVARKFGAKVLLEKRVEKNGIGYGFALQKGIREARGKIIICMDGDGSYPINKVPSAIAFLLKKDLDFISCNRLPFKSPKKMSAIRTFGVKILNSYAWFLFGYQMKDSLSGMWVFKNYAWEELNLSEGGWNLSLEIKLKTIINPKLKFAEYQIPYHDRIFDVSKQSIFETGIEHVLYLTKFKANLIWHDLLSLRLSYNIKQ
jgi:hypothetical protein